MLTKTVNRAIFWLLCNMHHKLAGRIRFQTTGNDLHWVRFWTDDGANPKGILNAPITLLIGKQEHGATI